MAFGSKIQRIMKFTSATVIRKMLRARSTLWYIGTLHDVGGDMGEKPTIFDDGSAFIVSTFHMSPCDIPCSSMKKTLCFLDSMGEWSGNSLSYNLQGLWSFLFLPLKISEELLGNFLEICIIL